jgi:hypothetical protein
MAPLLPIRRLDTHRFVYFQQLRCSRFLFRRPVEQRTANQGPITAQRYVTLRQLGNLDLDLVVDFPYSLLRFAF